MKRVNKPPKQGRNPGKSPREEGITTVLPLFLFSKVLSRLLTFSQKGEKHRGFPRERSPTVKRVVGREEATLVYSPGTMVSIYTRVYRETTTHPGYTTPYTPSVYTPGTPTPVFSVTGRHGPGSSLRLITVMRRTEASRLLRVLTLVCPVRADALLSSRINVKRLDSDRASPQ